MQLASLVKWIQGINNYLIAGSIRKIASPVYDRMTSTCLKSGGAIVITGAASTTAKTGAAITYSIANGVPVKIAAATNLAALSGTVANAQFGIYAWFQDQAGVVTSLFGGSFATFALQQFPQFPVGKACVGFVFINPTGTGPFVGGTTQLDDATVVPNAVYIDITEGFDPWCLIGGQPTNS